MTRNEGKFDRAVRIVLGLVLLTLFFVGQKTWIGLFGVIPLVTGILGYCPLYKLLGLRTCPVRP
jgi:cadmium resistance protein CadD (predicted permease)